MKRPAHGAFNGKGGSSSSSFAKLCGGSFRVGFRIHLKRQGRFLKRSRTFKKKNNGLFKKEQEVFLKDNELF